MYVQGTHAGKVVIDMALSINDVISLANAGFTKSDIAAFMNLGNPQTTPPSPVPVPGATEPVPVSSQLAPGSTPVSKADGFDPAKQAPTAPDYGQMITALENLSKKVEVLSNPVPSAGNVGALPTVTSVEDIIMGAIKPAAAPAADVDFMKGVVK